ncbi:MAG TPA: DUF6763 family protein [Steroidobacteraceae bacterium]|jgi:hypothetical protein|nr:DUF6763 family protein [Steroidobacteraceae bacterium]
MDSVGPPQIGDWYRRLDKGESFQVVNVDDASGNVEIQSFDGELDSIDKEDWDELELEATAEPPDWTGSMEDVEPDDVTEDDSPSDRGGNA